MRKKKKKKVAGEEKKKEEEKKRKYSDTSLERISRDQVSLRLRANILRLRANIECITESDQKVFLECHIGKHCLIGGCLGAGFHCSR